MFIAGASDAGRERVLREIGGILVILLAFLAFLVLPRESFQEDDMSVAVRFDCDNGLDRETILASKRSDAEAVFNLRHRRWPGGFRVLKRRCRTEGSDESD